MKLRVAKKVHERVATGRDLCYKRSTVRRAIFLYNRMPSSIATEKWWAESIIPLMPSLVKYWECKDYQEYLEKLRNDILNTVRGPNG